MRAVACVVLVALLACEREPPRYREPPAEPQWWLPGCPGVEGMRVGHDITPPRLLSRVEPVWPESARHLRGIVIIETVITAEGTVCAARVLRTFEGPEGDKVGEAALAAVRQWRFEPARLRGKPHPVFFSVTVVKE